MVEYVSSADKVIVKALVNAPELIEEFTFVGAVLSMNNENKLTVSEIVAGSIVRTEHTAYTIDEITEYHQMWQDGLISDDEFNHFCFKIYVILYHWPLF